MKKIITLTAILALICSAAACSSEKESSVPLNEVQYADDGRQMLTVASFGKITPKFAAYTKFPLDFKVEVINYCPDGTTYEEASRQLDMDMIQGKSPDILFAPPEKMYNYIRKGAMTDLFPLMDEYGGLTRDEFLPNVLEGLTVNGELPAVIDSFFLSTAVAKTKLVGDEYENWTAEQAMQFYNDLPEGMDFIDAADEELAEYMLQNIACECIDFENNTCDFSGSNFVDVLRFCAEHPVKERAKFDFEHAPDTEITQYLEDDSTRGLRDEQLVFPFTIDGFNQGLAYQAYGNLNFEDFTIVGLPSNDGSGARTWRYRQTNPYGILKGCSDKESAWKLVSSYIKYRKPLEKNANDGTLGIPVIKTLFDNDYDRDEDYNNSINRELFVPVRGANDNDNRRASLPQEMKDKLRDYIFSAKIDIYFPNELLDIVEEEYQPVLAGERTPEQAAEILDNRISIYLSEKS